MWFIFPQIAGLSHSPIAQKFALASLAEAKDYLSHPILELRLLECTRRVNNIADSTAEEIFGSVDSLKFRSSMTLFTHATKEYQCFEEALQKYFGGHHDQLTIERI